MAADTCVDDMTNDEILQNSSIPDIYDFVLSDDDLSFATESPSLDINASTLTHFKPFEIRPFPRNFIQGIRENSSPSLRNQVTDNDLANVIFESFEQLLSQPGSYHDLSERLLTFIIEQHQGVESPAKKERKGKKKDPNRRKMKNRVVKKPYRKSEKQIFKESENVGKKKAQRRKAPKKKSDVRTKACICLMIANRTKFSSVFFFGVSDLWPGRLYHPGGKTTTTRF